MDSFFEHVICNLEGSVGGEHCRHASKSASRAPALMLLPSAE